jgi:hypothetical protein
MKNLIFGCAVAVLLGSMAGCKQEAAAPSNVAVQTPTQPTDPNKPETPDPNKCYEGEVVFSYCPSHIWVEVKNGNIGDYWESPYKESFTNPVYKFNNVILLTNSHIITENVNLYSSTNPVKTKVFFRLKSDTLQSCQAADNNCVVFTNFTYPKKFFCAKSISTIKCN